MEKQSVLPLPTWVPEEACRYLDHTEAGRSIRQLARSAGCHPSTVLRQIRKIETRREDPLVDEALDRLATNHYAASAADEKTEIGALIGETRFVQEAVTVLRSLCHSGAVLAVADGMEKAVVVRESDLENAPKTVVSRILAEAFALRDWIGCDSPGRLSRYHITTSGRSAVSAMMAAIENRAQKMAGGGFSEPYKAFDAKNSCNNGRPEKPRRIRYGLAESPLDTLARLLDRDGNPFLSTGLVHAGERLREDFELAQIGDQLARNRAQFSTNTCGGGEPPSPAAAARKRAAGALNFLGAGLSDIAIRCCCHLEGLEAAERQLGWSARSGKVVLRIALEQLKAHYETLSGQGDMIG